MQFIREIWQHETVKKTVTEDFINNPIYTRFVLATGCPRKATGCPNKATGCPNKATGCPNKATGCLNKHYN